MRNDRIKYLIWGYVWLLVFEGALRRWIFPGLSDALLLVRDPIAILIFFMGFPILLNESNRSWFLSIFLFGIISCTTAMLFGHQDWLVTLWGARAPLLHFPLIFIIPEVLTKQDFWKFRKFFFILALPMTILLIFQFICPPEHWVNIGTGGEGTAGFGSVFGKARPPGTFSTITGTNNFYMLVAAFLFSSFSESKKPFPLYGWLIPACSLTALIFSISRGQIVRFSFLVIGFFISNAITKKAKNFLIFFLGIGFIFFLSFRILIQNDLAQDALFVTTTRWEGANAGEASQVGATEKSNSNIFQAILYRLHLDAFLDNFQKVSFFGYGIGIYSNPARFRIPEKTGLMLREVGDEENALAHSTLELGPLLGIIFLVWKFSFLIDTWLKVYRSAVKNKNPHGIIFFFLSFHFFVSFLLDQPNILGFAVFSLGLTLKASDF